MEKRLKHTLFSPKAHHYGFKPLLKWFKKNHTYNLTIFLWFIEGWK